MRNSVFLYSALACLLALAACNTLPRTVTLDELRTQQKEAVSESEELQHTLAAKLVDRLEEKARTASPGTTPTLNFLILSGGGQHGAFGAGFLSGWGAVKDGAMVRPEFDVVTGVSTGALIAPFALVGQDEAYDRVDEIYREVTKELAVLRGMLFFLPWKPSLYDNARLQSTLETELDPELLNAMVKAGKENRALLIGATDLDLGELHVWDLTQEAARGGDVKSRVRDILMASSAIPAAFPPVQIGDRLYVDGGASQMLFLGANADLFGEVVERMRVAEPKVNHFRIRLWVIINSKLFLDPKVVPERWTALARRSLDTLTKSSTLTALRRIANLTQLLPSRYPELDFEFRYVAIPQEIPLPRHSRVLFNPAITQMLSAKGKQLGADPTSWRTDVPSVQP